MKTQQFIVLDEDVTPDDVDVSSIVPKSELSPKIWENGVLKNDVKVLANKIAKNYIDFIFTVIEDSDIIDIQFTGSLANYNWSEYSDFDIHVVIDYSKISKNSELVSEYFRNKTTLYRIDRSFYIEGYEVELNITNNEPNKSNVGVYSLKYDKWIQEPSLDNTDIDYRSVKIKASQLMNQIDSTDCKLEDLKKLKKKIRKMRQSAINADGEYAIENLAFKLLRRNGYIKKLKDSIDNLEIKKL